MKRKYRSVVGKLVKHPEQLLSCTSIYADLPKIVNGIWWTRLLIGYGPIPLGTDSQGVVVEI